MLDLHLLADGAGDGNCCAGSDGDDCVYCPVCYFDYLDGADSMRSVGGLYDDVGE